MTELRAQLFGINFPASAAITVSGFGDQTSCLKFSASRLARDADDTNRISQDVLASSAGKPPRLGGLPTHVSG
jgi:hypothetical protein